MKELTIYYDHGHMTFYVDRYFPCLMQTARKVYPLIRKYATQEDLQMLQKYLEDYKENCKAQLIGYARKANECEHGSMQYRYYHARMSEVQTLAKRTKRNLELLTNGGMQNA